MKHSSALLVLAALATACTLGTRVYLQDQVLGELESALTATAARVQSVKERVVPPEPFALRRRETHVGARWGRAGDWLRRSEELFASRLDIAGLPHGTPISVWILGEDLVAAEVHRAEDAGGPLLALPALAGGLVRFYDEQGRALDGAFVARPVAYNYVSSRFGLRVHPFSGRAQLHRGVDLSAPRGTAVVSVGDGVVVRVAEAPGPGRHVVVRHRGGWRTKYYHLDAWAEGLVPGARVKRGQEIGTVGSTGMSTGPHLHFEVLRAGVGTDPVALEWPAGAKLPKAALPAHKKLAAQLRSMAPDEAWPTWPEDAPLAGGGAAAAPQT